MTDMKDMENDRWRELFKALPEEPLPTRGFEQRVMDAAARQAALRVRRLRRWEIFGYAAGIVVMLAACGVSLHLAGVEMPQLTWTLPQINIALPDFPFEMFASPAFKISFGVGVAAFLLLAIDEILRRHIEKRHKTTAE
jgi:hypothetical protein